MNLTSQLSRELKAIVSLDIGTRRTRERFYKRISELNLTRDQNAKSHFSVYFVPIRLNGSTPELWIGYHLKAQQYLPPGGHIDHDRALGRDERCIETLHREFKEEFNVELPEGFSINPFWISITRIDNDTQRCKEHLDIWYAINVTGLELAQNSEFINERWVTIADARHYINDPACVEGLTSLERYLKNSQLEEIK